MIPVEDPAALDAAIAEHPALLVLFGGPTCGICTAVKPKLEAMLAARFPKLQTRYVDGDAHPELMAQAGIHTRPVVRIYFDGALHKTYARAFGVDQVAGDIARPYGLMFD